MQTPRVSVIIPVYNTASYLQKCLDSVLKQALGDIEVICVENGSTDDSLDVLREYEKKDHRLKVVVHPEGRLGDARNAGVERATGTYIGFVDSDDFIATEMYERLYTSATKYDADLAICGVMTYNDLDGKCVEKEPGMLHCEECVNLSDHRLLFRSMTAWNKLYKREFLEQHGFRFPEDIFYEDQLYVSRAYLLANRIAVVNEPCYYYRKDRPGQISTLSGRQLFDVFTIFKDLDAFAASQGLPQTHLQDIAEQKVNALFYLFRYVAKEHRREFFNKMKYEFCASQIVEPPHFLSSTYYNNYLIVRDHGCFTACLLMRCKDRIGRLLTIPFIKKLYLAMRPSRRTLAL